MIALGLRIWMAYGVLGLSTAALLASVPGAPESEASQAAAAVAR